MRIVLLSPYHGGSHRAWAEGWAARSRHRIDILGLPDQFWKWRLHGGAVRLADEYRRCFLGARRDSGAPWAEGRDPGGRGPQVHDAGARDDAPVDLLVVTDMLDLTTFLALTREETAGIPVFLYAHENQWTYPLPEDPNTGPMRRQKGERDRHYAWINFVSMLAADRIGFNSSFHREEFLQSLPGFLNHYPDEKDPAWIGRVESRSSVLPLGIDLARLDRGDAPAPIPALSPTPTPTPTPAPAPAPAPATAPPAAPVPDGETVRSPLASSPSSPADIRAPLILWNHRWEYDKDPEAFFQAVDVLSDRGIEFQLAVCGKNARTRTPEFDAARERHRERIVHWGPADAEAYRDLLHAATVVVSTARHEFFGISVCEAIYCGAFPVLPDRLSYPELIPEDLHSAVLYTGARELVDRLVAVLSEPHGLRSPADRLRAEMARHDWSLRASEYDDQLEVWFGDDRR